MLSLHDHFVRQLSVDANAKQLQIATAYPQTTGPQFAEALFEGVAAYVIEGDALETILFDVEEIDPLVLYDRLGQQLQTSYLKSGGHAPWTKSRDEAMKLFSADMIRGFEITSSIGFTGAVWARSLTARWVENL